MTLEIFMPFYGSFEHFRDAVESVRAQDDPDWTLTIVDDVNPDLAPGLWAQSLGDARIRYLRNDENLRPSRNYNKCVGLATGEFMVLMGCDDIMLPGYVGRVSKLLAEHPGADIVQPGVEVIDENGAVVDPLADRIKRLYRPGGRGPRETAGEPLARGLLRGNWTYFPSLVWRTERLTAGFRTDLDVVQDLAMLFQIAADGGVLIVDDEIAFRYRRHSRSLSAITGPDGSKFRQERSFFQHAAARSAQLGWPGAARAARWHVSSRLHALTELPAAIVAGNASGRSTLLRHAFGMRYRDSA